MNLTQALQSLRKKVTCPEGTGKLMGIDLTYDLPAIVMLNNGNVRFFKLEDVKLKK